MKMRMGFTSCAVLVLLAVANAAGAQQPRERRQDRRAPPKQEQVGIDSTVLFEQADVPYQVLHGVEDGTEVCLISMADKEAKTAFFIETNASDRTTVIAVNFADPPPASYARLGAKQSLRLEVDGVAQSYNIENFRPKDSPKAAGKAFAWGAPHVPPCATSNPR